MSTEQIPAPAWVPQDDTIFAQMNALENTGQYGTRVSFAWNSIYLVVYDDGHNVPYAYFVLRKKDHDVVRDADGRVVIQFYDDAQNAGYPGTYKIPGLNDPVGTAGIPPVVDATILLRREELPLSTVLQHSITLYDADDAPVPPEPPARPKKGQPKPDVKGKLGRCGGYCTLSAAAAAGSRPSTRIQLFNTIRSLKRRALEDLLLDAACDHPDVAESITSERDEEAHQVVDFDHYSRSAWHALNVEYERMRPSQQFHAGGDVASSIRKMFSTMARKSPARASYGTKRSAVETMRKICQMIVDAEGSELAKVVRNSVDGLGAHMLTVVKRFTPEELDRLVAEDGGEWYDVLVETLELVESDGIVQERDVDKILDIVLVAVRRQEAAATHSSSNNNHSGSNSGNNSGNDNDTNSGSNDNSDEDQRGEDGIDAEL